MRLQLLGPALRLVVERVQDPQFGVRGAGDDPSAICGELQAELQIRLRSAGIGLSEIQLRQRLQTTSERVDVDGGYHRIVIRLIGTGSAALGTAGCRQSALRCCNPCRQALQRSAAGWGLQ